MLKLIEIILLDKLGMAVPQSVVQKRLEYLSTPAAFESNSKSVQQTLSMIDEYLGDQNQQAVLKEVIQLAKPYFMEQINTRLEEEANNVLQNFRKDDLQVEVMTHFFMSDIFGKDWTESDFWQKLENYDEESETIDTFNAAMPLHSPTFRRKQLLGAFGSDIFEIVYNKDLSLAQKQEMLVEAARTDMAGLERFDLKQEEEKEDRMDDARDFIEDVQFTDKDPRGTDDFLSRADKNEISSLRMMERYVHNYMLDHEHEIKNHMSALDWCEIYGKAILEFNMDFQGQCAKYSETKDKDITLRKEFRELSRDYENDHWNELAEYA